MAIPLPPEIQVVELADGVRYVLPRRNLGPLRFISFVPMLFGLPFLAGGLFTLSTGVGKVIHGGTGEIFEAIFLALFATPFLLVGVFATGAGIIIAMGHTEVEISGGQLRVRERAGPVHWTALRRLEDLSRISVFNAFLGDLGAANPRLRPAEAPPRVLANKARAIIAECKSKPLLKIAGGYPPEWLEPLADDLTQRINDLRLTAMPGSLPVELADVPQAVLDSPAVAPAETAAPPPREPIQQPTGSRCTFEPRPNGLTITVPALGMRGHLWGLLIMGLIFTAMPIGMFILITKKPGGPPIWFIGPFFSLFLAVGIGLTLTALNLATRRAIIDAVAGTLLVTQAGLFGRKQREWPAADLAALYRGPSNMKVNNRPLLQLTVEPRDGNVIGLMAGSNEDDLAWIADVLRRTLGVPASREENAEA
ncbi:MAG: hypothetical protein K8S99_16355 [Planctomycetes bacterium]|nr:hypothetical protein [Planctomycetota bacterium]